MQDNSGCNLTVGDTVIYTPMKPNDFPMLGTVVDITDRFVTISTGDMQVVRDRRNITRFTDTKTTSEKWYPVH
ncbi:hypothetical protein inny_228 [Escherichia phage inny]|nr:hypothetical protein inny_228 [Escherichia phage inny]